MHRTTIVQNKIISTIRSCFFFCPANIYRHNLGRGWLGRPNPKVSTALNFYLRRGKKYHSIQNCTHYNFALDIFKFHLFSFKYITKICKKYIKTFTNIYTKYSLIPFLKISNARLLWSLFRSQRNLVHHAAINNKFGIQFLNSKITSVGKMDFHIFTINTNYIHICIIYINNLY